MVKKFRASAIILLIIPLVLMMISCAKKDIQAGQATIEDEEGALSAEIIDGEEGVANLQQDGALSEEQLDAQRREAEAKAIKEEFVNEDIYFGFDSATLEVAAQEILRKKARWLENNPEAVIVIEGHCDNRGTEAYNLALGERRAESAKAFLSDLGIDVTKIMTISYGEERPIDPGETENAWTKNRRASFVIQ